MSVIGCNAALAPAVVSSGMEQATNERINAMITKARRALQNLENEMIEAGLVGPRDVVAAAERMLRPLDARSMSAEIPEASPKKRVTEAS